MKKKQSGAVESNYWEVSAVLDASSDVITDVVARAVLMIREGRYACMGKLLRARLYRN